MPEYTIGICSICGKREALKDGVCAKCNENGELPNIFKNLFDNVRKEKV
jgi:hypothetical protein